MHIITNQTPQSLQKNFSFSGAHIFGEAFLRHISTTKHTFTAFSFIKPSQQPKNNFEWSVAKRVGHNKWIAANILITTNDIMSLSTKKPTAIALKAMHNLAELIKKQNADVFYLNGFSGMAYLLFKAAYTAGLPIVCGHHGIWYKESLAIQSNYSKTDLNLSLRKKVEQELAQHAQKNIFLTNAGVKEFEKFLGKVPKKQIAIIPLPYNPIFTKGSVPKPAGANKDLNIGIVGRWDKVKNHEAVLNLAKESTKHGLNWNFFAVTRIHDYKAYHHLADEYARHVKIVNQTTPANLRRFYQKMNIIIVPSLFETYSGVVMESLLQNRIAVISPNVPWVDIYKKHKLGHLITDFKNPQKTVKILKVASKTKVPAALRKEILKNNKPEAIYSEYIKVFNSVIK